MSKSGQDKIYQMVTDRMICAIEEAIEKAQNGEAIIPWHKPWNVSGLLPANLISKKSYRGWNVWALAFLGYSSPYFLTAKQAINLGGNIKKGQKGCPVIFWNFKIFDEGTSDEKKIPFLRYYTVFNVDQCEGIDDKIPKMEYKPLDFNPIEEAEKIINNMPNKPEIFDDARAVYYPEKDNIGMPIKDRFNNEDEYYSTLFHELIHATGHKTRLNRPTLIDMSPFGSQTYSKEELVAEMGATFLINTANIKNDVVIQNSVAYLQNWLKKLKDDPKLLIRAAAMAQKASDYILNIKFEKDDTNKSEKSKS